MRLVGEDGRFIVLDVMGYEFPTYANPPGYDWLEVEGQVSDGANTWDLEDPILTAGDLVALGGWLTSLSRGELKPETSFLFSEPASIWMKMVAPSTVRVGFGGAGLAWNAEGPRPPWPDPLEFYLDDAALASLIDDVSAASQRFPERPSDWVPSDQPPRSSWAAERPTRSWAELIRRLFSGR